jgi:eukaryotic-like serine/threonine-protein kinase
MTPDRWLDVERVYHAASALPADRRADFLAQACAEDDGLRREVESLLAHELSAENFLTTPAMEAPVEVVAQVLSDGTIFGPYRILHLLGRGGMGIVYAADEVDSGRHVALKVIAAPLRGQGERDRFLREGQLAASINHPNCVYVFGACEIEGRPAIALEPMLETLADRLRRDGPLPAAAAVDATLQVARGLAAAAESGILHRDIKPSNCFIGEHGLVKIGDFGISRSLRPAIDTRQVSRLGQVVGTPTHASPEQLRGVALDTRSDIYSVGATLFELLTGRTPFDAADLVSLLMAVANDPPPAPSAFNRTIPKGLNAVVLRCLAKKPEQRFADYPQLVAALEPFSSATHAAATPGRRVIAGTIDLAIVSTPLIALSMIFPMADATDRVALPTILLYFGLLESLWGATLGKLFCGLAVVGADRQSASRIRVTIRGAVYAICLLSIRFVSSRQPAGLEHALGAPLAFWTVRALALLPAAILFSTARHHNGFAGLHDLASGTRVVERRVRGKRTGLAMVTSPSRHVIVGRAGPYDVLPDAVGGLGSGWRWGFDPRLLRSVWLRFSDPATPHVPSARRGVIRGTRLRWLAGRRLEAEAWDAYEAVEGAPLSKVAHEWTDIRWWLLDLAKECAATTAADQAPRSPERVWTLASGGIKWLDDPAADAVAPSDSVATDQQLLIAVARRALGREADTAIASSVSGHPLPLGASRFFEHLLGPTGNDMGEMVRELDALTKQRAVLTRAWRVAPIAISALVPALALTVVMALSANMDIHLSHLQVDERTAGVLLWQLALADRKFLTLAVEERESIELVLATRYRDVMSDGRLFTPRNMSLLNLQEFHRAIASDLLRRYPLPLPDTQAHFGARTAAVIRRANGQETPRPLVAQAFQFYLAVAVLALVANLTLRRGLIRIMGLELVTADGRPASRLRVLARTAMTWTPVLVVPFVMRFGARIPPDLDRQPWWMLGMIAGAIVIAIWPSRGVQDRLAGTWVVPR